MKDFFCLMNTFMNRSKATDKGGTTNSGLKSSYSSTACGDSVADTVLSLPFEASEDVRILPGASRKNKSILVALEPFLQLLPDISCLDLNEQKVLHNCLYSAGVTAALSLQKNGASGTSALLNIARESCEWKELFNHVGKILTNQSTPLFNYEGNDSNEIYRKISQKLANPDELRSESGQLMKMITNEVAALALTAFASMIYRHPFTKQMDIVMTPPQETDAISTDDENGGPGDISHSLHEPSLGTRSSTGCGTTVPELALDSLNTDIMGVCAIKVDAPSLPLDSPTLANEAGQMSSNVGSNEVSAAATSKDVDEQHSHASSAAAFVSNATIREECCDDENLVDEEEDEEECECEDEYEYIGDEDCLFRCVCSIGCEDLAKLLVSLRHSTEFLQWSDSTPLMEACCGGYTGVVRMLIQAGANINALSSTKNTALTYACASRRVECVRELLKSGNCDVNIRNDIGHCALMVAASIGNVEILKMLVEHGATPLSAVDNHDFKESALTLAAYKGHLDAVKYLLSVFPDDVDERHRDEEFHSALMEASMDGHVDVARALLEFGAKTNLPSDSFESPLTLAACSGHVDLVSLLIDFGAKLEEANDEGYTPLMEACREGHRDVVELLLNRGANVNAKIDEGMETPLTLAASGGYLNVIELLVERGGDLTVGSPLCEATQEGHTDVACFIIKQLRQIGSPVEILKDLNSSLMCAAELDNAVICNVLLENMAEVDCFSQDGRTPLMEAAKQGNLQVVELLIHKNANVNAMSPNGEWTALSLAASHGHAEVVRCLLNHGADPIQSLSDSSTCLLEATKSGHMNCVEVLLDYKSSIDNSPPLSPTPSEKSKNFKNENKPPLSVPKTMRPKSKSFSQKDAYTSESLQMIATSMIKSPKGMLSPNIGKSGEKTYTNRDYINAFSAIFQQQEQLIQQHLAASHLSKSSVSSQTSCKASQTTPGNISTVPNDMSPSAAATTSASNLFRAWAATASSSAYNGLEEHFSQLFSVKKPLSEEECQNQQHCHYPHASSPTPSISSVGDGGITTPNGTSSNPICACHNIASIVSSDASTMTNMATTVGVTAISNERTSSTAATIPPPAGMNVNNVAATNQQQTQQQQHTCDSAFLEAQTESNADTALTMACVGGHTDIASLLIQRGFDIEHRDKKGFTPLILCATGGHAEICRKLLEAGCQVDAQADRTKDTALSLACSGGRKEIVEMLLLYGANKEHRNISDYTPLSLAASGGYVEIIQMLLNNGAEINSRTGSKLGISPLMLAAMNGHESATQLLLDNGSDINAQIETNRNTALTLACFQGRTEVVRLLLQYGANMDHRAKTGLTPLMEAANGGYVDVGALLLDAGADPNTAPVMTSRDTALTIAADKGHAAFVELLIHSGAHINVRNKKGNSALWLASCNGHLETVKTLVKHNADADAQDNRKVSPLMIAFRKGHVPIVEFIVGHVTQHPNDQECDRYIATLTEQDLISKCTVCFEFISRAKSKQAEEANKAAESLLELLAQEEAQAESKKRTKQRQKEKKKAKKNAKKLTQVEDDDQNDVEEDTKKTEETSQDEQSVLDEPKSSAELPTLSEKISDDAKPIYKKCQSKSSRFDAETCAANTFAGSGSEDMRVPSLNPMRELDGGETNLAKVATKTLSERVISPITTASTNFSSSNGSRNSTRNKDISGGGAPKNGRRSARRGVRGGGMNFEAKAAAVVASKFAGVYDNSTSTGGGSSKIGAIPEESDAWLHPSKRRVLAVKNGNKAIGVHQHVGTRLVTNSITVHSKSLSGDTSSHCIATPTIDEWVAEPGTVALSSLSKRKTSHTLSVSSASIARVIGRSGSNINAIREATNAHIEVEKMTTKREQATRLITIKGTSEAIRNSVFMIEMLIKEQDLHINDILRRVMNTSSTTPPSVVVENFLEFPHQQSHHQHQYQQLHQHSQLQHLSQKLNNNASASGDSTAAFVGASSAATSATAVLTTSPVAKVMSQTQQSTRTTVAKPLMAARLEQPTTTNAIPVSSNCPTQLINQPTAVVTNVWQQRAAMAQAQQQTQQQPSLLSQERKAPGYERPNSSSSSSAAVATTAVTMAVTTTSNANTSHLLLDSQMFHQQRLQQQLHHHFSPDNSSNSTDAFNKLSTTTDAAGFSPNIIGSSSSFDNGEQNDEDFSIFSKLLTGEKQRPISDIWETSLSGASQLSPPTSLNLSGLFGNGGILESKTWLPASSNVSTGNTGAIGGERRTAVSADSLANNNNSACGGGKVSFADANESNNPTTDNFSDWLSGIFPSLDTTPETISSPIASQLPLSAAQSAVLAEMRGINATAVSVNGPAATPTNLPQVSKSNNNSTPSRWNLPDATWNLGVNGTGHDFGNCPSSSNSVDFLNWQALTNDIGSGNKLSGNDLTFNGILSDFQVSQYLAAFRQQSHQQQPLFHGNHREQQHSGGFEQHQQKMMPPNCASSGGPFSSTLEAGRAFAFMQAAAAAASAAQYQQQPSHAPHFSVHHQHQNQHNQNLNNGSVVATSSSGFNSIKGIGCAGGMSFQQHAQPQQPLFHQQSFSSPQHIGGSGFGKSQNFNNGSITSSGGGNMRGSAAFVYPPPGFLRHPAGSNDLSSTITVGGGDGALNNGKLGVLHTASPSSTTASASANTTAARNFYYNNYYYNNN